MIHIFNPKPKIKTYFIAKAKDTIEDMLCQTGIAKVISKKKIKLHIKRMMKTQPFMFKSHSLMILMTL